MKRFLGKSLFLLPLPLLIATVNYTIDPAHIFDTDHAYEKRVADLLLSGSNVANVGNCDDRLLQRFYVQGLTASKDIVVVGASRAIQISASFFDGPALFNNSVQQAVTEDFIAVYEMYHRRGLKPRVMVLGPEPWVLNGHHKISKWLSVADEVRSAERRMNVAASAEAVVPTSLGSHRAFELFSLSYFQASVKESVRVWSGRESRRSCYATDQIEGDVDIKLADGSLRYNYEYETRSAAAVSVDAFAYATAPPADYYDGFTVLSAAKTKQMEAFVDLLQREGVRVVFFLAPFHPEVYKRFAEPKHNRLCVVEAEVYFRDLAARKKLDVVGSYDPTRCGFDEAVFLDAHHPRMSGLQKLNWSSVVQN